MTSSKDLKKQLRREALGRRDALDPMWRVEIALEMAETARDHLTIEPGQIVSAFWPMRSEVDVRPLMFALREKGARLCLPAILDKTTIVFRELVRGAPMVEMGFGTVGPHATAARDGFARALDSGHGASRSPSPDRPVAGSGFPRPAVHRR